jgi:hypothetical protein
MHDVTEVPFGFPCKTHLWLSQRAQDEITHFRKRGDPNGAYWKRVARFAKDGFGLHDQGEFPPIRHEWDNVYRIGFVDSLFRLIGFYEDPSTKSDFIAIDAFLKKKKKLNRSERDRIDKVAEVRRLKQWRKV